MEIVDVVDNNDLVIATALKTDVYSLGLSNRIVHVFVINPTDGSIYIQKRSATVNYLPNYYCTSAGGHVGAGEEYEDAARRELLEEIGLSTDLKFVEKIIFNCAQTNPPTPRFLSIFVTYANEGISFHDGEVADGAFLLPKQIEELFKKNIAIHPQLEPAYRALEKSNFMLHHNAK